MYVLRASVEGTINRYILEFLVDSFTQVLVFIRIPQNPVPYTSNSVLRVFQSSEQTIRQRAKSTSAQEVERRKII